MYMVSVGAIHVIIGFYLQPTSKMVEELDGKTLDRFYRELGVTWVIERIDPTRSCVR